jgi:hypothetical protein
MSLKHIDSRIIQAVEMRTRWSRGVVEVDENKGE